MGHEVVEIAFPSNQVQLTPEIMSKIPTLEKLLSFNLTLIGYMEYTQPWLQAIYPFDEWKKVMAKVPIIARFDESMDRGDLWLPQRVPDLLNWATHHSFPAAQDAEKYKGQWLPYGADTTIFHPPIITVEQLNNPTRHKKYPVGFIGTVYPKRNEYLQKLLPHVGKNTAFYAGNVLVQDISGIAERETTERLAMNYRGINIFFCLPSMSRLLVEKVFDVMACDTMVMYPRFPGEAEKNFSIFEDGKHIVYYELGFYADNGKQIQHYLANPAEVERIARNGGELVRSQFTLEQMMQKMLDLAKEPA